MVEILMYPFWMYIAYHFYVSLFLGEPNCLLHGHDGPAYDVKIYGDDKRSLLLR